MVGGGALKIGRIRAFIAIRHQGCMSEIGVTALICRTRRQRIDSKDAVRFSLHPRLILIA